MSNLSMWAYCISGSCQADCVIDEFQPGEFWMRITTWSHHTLLWPATVDYGIQCAQLGTALTPCRQQVGADVTHEFSCHKIALDQSPFSLPESMPQCGSYPRKYQLRSRITAFCLGYWVSFLSHGGSGVFDMSPNVAIEEQGAGFFTITKYSDTGQYHQLQQFSPSCILTGCQ